MNISTSIVNIYMWNSGCIFLGQNICFHNIASNQKERLVKNN